MEEPKFRKGMTPREFDELLAWRRENWTKEQKEECLRKNLEEIKKIKVKQSPHQSMGLLKNRRQERWKRRI